MLTATAHHGPTASYTATRMVGYLNMRTRDSGRIQTINKVVTDWIQASIYLWPLKLFPPAVLPLELHKLAVVHSSFFIPYLYSSPGRLVSRESRRIMTIRHFTL